MRAIHECGCCGRAIVRELVDVQRADGGWERGVVRVTNHDDGQLHSEFCVWRSLRDAA